jgi:hypothetical protein
VLKKIKLSSGAVVYSIKLCKKIAVYLLLLMEEIEQEPIYFNLSLETVFLDLPFGPEVSE